MTIAEKYAQQYRHNGEASLADLIQAAVDEAQSVPVVGDAVGFILIHEDGGRNLTFHDNTGELSDGWSQHKLVIQPATAITAAELATLREKAAMADELRKDAERLQYMIDDTAIITYSFGPNKTMCRLEWPLSGFVQDAFYPSERAAIDAAIAQGKGE